MSKKSKNKKQVIIDSNILELYQCPDLLDVYVTNLSETKK